MSMVMIKQTKLNSSTGPKHVLQKQKPNLSKDAKSKLASRKNVTCVSPPEHQGNKTKPIEHDAEIYQTKSHVYESLDLCERVEHISNQLAKLSNPYPADKFLRNSEHRGYIMSYPEVLPVYTASKLSTVQDGGNYYNTTEELPIRIDKMSPFTTALKDLTTDFRKSESFAGCTDFSVNKDIIHKDVIHRDASGIESGICKNDQFSPLNYTASRNDTKYNPADDPEGTLEELVSHLLRQHSPSRSQSNDLSAQGNKPSEPKPSELVMPEPRLSSAPPVKQLSHRKIESNKQQSSILSSPLSKAASTLETVSRRRIHLENNLDALGRTQFSQSIFEILQQLGESGSSCEKARVQARIIDAIEAVQKKKCSSNLPGRPTSLLQKKKNKGGNNQRSSSQSPGPCSAHTLTEFLSTEFESSDMMPRSVSPSMRPAPWRFNRTRVKRPGYPRIVNDPVPARRATVKLGDKKDVFVVPMKSSVATSANSPNVPMQSIRIPKAVHFHQKNIPGHENRSANKPVRSISSACQTNERHVRLGIIPLGRAQYSALTLSMESVNPTQEQSGNVTDRGWKPTQDAAVEFSSEERSDVDDGHKSKHQPQTMPSFPTGQALWSHTQPSAGRLSEVDVRSMIEAAVLKHVQPEKPSTPLNLEERLPTPDLSPDFEPQSEHHHSLRTPVRSPDQMSPTRSCHSRLDVAVGFSSRNSPNFSYLNKQAEAGTSYELEGFSDHAVKTPKSSSTSSSSAIRTPCSPRSPHAESIRRSAAVYIQTSPVRMVPTTEKEKPEYSSFSSPKDFDGVSGTESNLDSDIEFSLTAANTFSDGLWLIDRSEGEAPQPMLQEAYEKIATNADFTLQPSMLQLSGISASNSCTSDGDHDVCERRLSDGEYPQANHVIPRPNPMTNPLLEIMALNASNRFHASNLTEADRKQVKKITSEIRSGDPRSAKIDWLAGLSGLKTNEFSKASVVVPSSSSTESKVISHYAENNNKLADDHETLVGVQTCTIHESLSLASLDENIPVNGVAKLIDATTNPIQSVRSLALDAGELVQSVDSDTTTINDPVYDDDYVTDTSTPSTN